MPRKVKIKYHYLYKTTNMINGKYYIGVHSTYEIKDGYLGSGTKLWNSIYKYGKENFVKEELEFFETREELLKREKEIVNEQLLNDPLCMNLKPGGSGGFCNEKHRVNFINSSKTGRINANKSLANRVKTDEKFREHFKKQVSKGLKKRYEKIPKIGIKHAEETKRKISESMSKLTGEKNSQFGTCWIYKGIENKKIKKDQLNYFIDLGWTKGRKYE